MSKALIDWRPPGRMQSVLTMVGGTLLLIGLWESAGRYGWLGTMLPPPSAIARAACDRVNQRILLRATAATLPDILSSFFIGSVLAVAAAFVQSVVPPLRHLVHRFFVFLSVIPLIVLAPVLVSILGVNAVPRAIGALSAFLPMFIAASSGFSTTRGSFVDLIKVFGGRTVEEFRYVRLPSTVLIMADGLQLSALAAAFGVLFGEWFGADQGLGVLLITSMQNYKIELLWLAALTATALSNAGMMLIGVATRYAARRFA